MAARNINVNLYAQTSGFVKGMKRAGDSFKHFQAIVSSVVSVAAIKKFADTIIDAALAIDNLATQAEKIGVATRELGTLQHAANMMDVSASSLDASLIKMNKTLGEAALGATAQKEALSRLGIKISDIIDKKPDQQFLEIASALSNIGNKAIQTKLAMDIFGRGAADLSPIFNKSSSEIRKFIEEGRAFTSSLSDETIKAAMDVDDALKRMSASWKNFKNTLVEIYGPGISGILEFLTPGGGSADFLPAIPMRESVENSRKALSDRINRARETIRRTSSDDDLHQRLLRGLPKAIEQLAEFDRMLKNIDRKNYNEKFDRIFKPLVGDDVLRGGFRSLISGARGAFDDISRQAELAAFRTESAMRRMIDSQREAIEESAKEIREMLMEPIDILDRFRRETEKLVGVEGGLTRDEFERAVSKRARELGLLTDQILDVPEFNSPGALLRGSQEEFSSRVQATQDRVQDEIRKELEEQTKIAKKTESHASDMVRVMKLIEEHNRDIAVAN